MMQVCLPHFSNARILIIGDVMLDRYWHGTTSRISPEAPVPIVHINQQEERPGGAGNVALNIAALGAQATLIGMTGIDAAAQTILTQLTEKQVQCNFIQSAHIPTITKLRILSRHQQLIRLDFEEPLLATNDELITQMQTYLSQVDAVILSDYGKGTLCNPVQLIQLAKAAHKPIFIDPKGKDFTKYIGATLITPNLSEFEAIVGHCTQQAILIERGENLRDSLQLDALLITRSEQGMTLLQRGKPALHLPTQAREVFDVTGAGDTVISVLATSLAVGADMVQATMLANVAAGLVIAKLGATTVNPAELAYALQVEHKNGIHRADSLQLAVQMAKSKGEKIVMTNGCFDILHAGHIQYLTQARQLGDRLIVAVNDDQSVQRLKGSSRPINPLEQRMAVLEALRCVDWVVPFSQDTPRELICQILPDILVKGGDYQLHEIAGNDCVLAQGGQVRVLDFLPGCSTSRIIAAGEFNAQ